MSREQGVQGRMHPAGATEQSHPGQGAKKNDPDLFAKNLPLDESE
jgi:hypothetical protein